MLLHFCGAAFVETAVCLKGMRVAQHGDFTCCCCFTLLKFFSFVAVIVSNCCFIGVHGFQCWWAFACWIWKQWNSGNCENWIYESSFNQVKLVNYNLCSWWPQMSRNHHQALISLKMQMIFAIFIMNNFPN